MPPPADNASERRPNGDVNYDADADSGASAPPPAPIQKQATAPPVNVWAARKEQMARAFTQGNPPQPVPPSANTSSVPGSLPGSREAQDSSANTSTSMNTVKTTLLAMNSHSALPADFDDPFVVKPGRSPSSLDRTPPAIDDAESWPEVGQAAAISSVAEGGKNKEGDERKHERESSQGQGPRKGTFIPSISLVSLPVLYHFVYPLFLYFGFTPNERADLIVPWACDGKQERSRDGYPYPRRTCSSKDLHGRVNAHKSERILVILLGLRAQDRLRRVRGLNSKAGHIQRAADGLHPRIRGLCHTLKLRAGPEASTPALDILVCVEVVGGCRTTLVYHHPMSTGSFARRDTIHRQHSRNPSHCQYKSSFPVGRILP